MKKTRLVFTLCSCVAASCCIPTFAEVDVYKLIASDAAAGAHDGNSVSISGDYAVVGALTGSAYIYESFSSPTAE